jgi:O-antigen/teichoic acid export membrane protein
MSAITSFLWRTSASSYLRTLLRVALGLGTFRILYTALPAEDFGFWALLWSVFGFGVLVDFGLGFATQKRVAELSAHQNWEELSRVLSTILVTFCGLGLVVFLVAFIGKDALLRGLHLTPGNETRYGSVALVFFIGMALGFPLGIFPEILRGQQRVSLVNLIVCGGLVLNFIAIFVAIKCGWSLTVLVSLALATTLGPDLVCGIVALRSLPGVRLHPQLFSIATAKQTMGFSLVAYLITATNIVLGKTDQLVLGACLSVASVAVYVAGAKVAEIF